MMVGGIQVEKVTTASQRTSSSAVDLEHWFHWLHLEPTYLVLTTLSALSALATLGAH
jgi:hypothetical protein